MNLDEMIIATFCEMDDAVTNTLHKMPQQRLRSRGPQPRLSDSEVLTMEVVGAYLGLEQDKALFNYFRRHYLHFFPALAGLHRTTFVRQATNLWKLKEYLWQYWLQSMPHHQQFGMIDSLPLPVCRFARATFCRRFRYADVQDLQATYGYDHVARQTFWGLRLHLHMAWPGLVTRLTLTSANAQDVSVAPQLLAGKSGLVLGDRNYHAPALTPVLQEQAPALKLLTPFKSKKHDPDPRRSAILSHWRYRIETLNSQLCGRFATKRVWARDVWHLTNRLLRTVLSHTLCVRLNWQREQAPLQLAQLVH